MLLVMTFVIFSLAVAGCMAFNDNGSYTHSRRRKALGFVAHFIALVCAMWLFGALRGLFIYIAILSLVGILFPLFYRLKNKPKR